MIVPPLNINLIELPSDGLTVWNIRKQHGPSLTTRMPAHYIASMFSPIHHALGIECLLAERFYRQATQQPDQAPHITTPDAIANLNRFYVSLGISDGLHSTEELVRRIAQQSTQQAHAARQL